ncbi:hypothetical protein BDN72DRAFT_894771 [Pluteus cervinus]|uniref:Uncharacterized protein n=1 Tax=Pluteus cervinus TaxID=181527 RepID=A0ACD3B2V9_9AGAR|nr:hypothetical protein BDN72DRAFT_894771 [Pluteus cervinus]
MEGALQCQTQPWPRPHAIPLVVNLSRRVRIVSTGLLLSRPKRPLHQAREACGLEYPKSANLERLRGILDNYCPLLQPHDVSTCFFPKNTAQAKDEDEDEDSLVETYGITGAFAEEVLGYDLEHDDKELEEDEDDDDDEESAFEQFKTQVRVSATRRAEGNRRPGGLKTQKAMVRAWNEFVQQARQKRELADDIVDEHSLLLCINYSAERPKRTRQRVDIPGTFIGAVISAQKNSSLGLRIRKEQDAMDKTLARRRPATTVVVWDAIKDRMNEALERARKRLAPNEDAPDIVANTFLAEITDEQRIRVGDALRVSPPIPKDKTGNNTLHTCTGDLETVVLYYLSPRQSPIYPTNEVPNASLARRRKCAPPSPIYHLLTPSTRESHNGIEVEAANTMSNG